MTPVVPLASDEALFRIARASLPEDESGEAWTHFRRAEEYRRRLRRWVKAFLALLVVSCCVAILDVMAVQNHTLPWPTFANRFGAIVWLGFLIVLLEQVRQICALMRAELQACGPELK